MGRSCHAGAGGRLRAPQSLVKNSSGSLSRERPFGSVSGFWPNWHRGAAGTRSGDAPTAAIRAIGCSCKADAPASTRRDRRMRAKAMLSRQGKLSAALCWRVFFNEHAVIWICCAAIQSLSPQRAKSPRSSRVDFSWLRRCCRVDGSRLSCSSLLHLAHTCCLHGVRPNARCCPRQHSGTVQWLLALTRSRLPTRWRT